MEDDIEDMRGSMLLWYGKEGNGKKFKMKRIGRAAWRNFLKYFHKEMHVSQAQQFFLDLPIKATRLQAWRANHVSTKHLHLRIPRDAGMQIARIYQNAKGLKERTEDSSKALIDP